ncbi:MAG TPA: CbiX/SirB N-terminal domain-containing protein [Streptosporangiaceae bacterium]|nr:CbiX/SirB N-terminal domain-containing protein [Streptosporangiaceae bacterium]
MGRHRSMHRISVASDAPVLVLAIPGAGNDHDSELADQIAEAATESCPGVEIRIGFIASETDSLRDALATEPTSTAQSKDGIAAPQSVIVPLLAGSHPTIDQQLEAVVGRLRATTMLAPHLGPHPLLAGALHDRLSEVGLARAGRARGLNISAGANGVLVVADRGPQAVSDAGVTAVLLAARLAVPVLPASLGDSASITAALDRLREAGATHPAIAPCLIGPETDPSELTQLSSAIDAPCAAPLGAHPAIAQLVAIRYGEALARISVASR